MWRAIFLSFGLTLMLLGLECLFVEQIVIKDLRVGSRKKADVVNYDPFQTASYRTNSSQNSGPPRYRVFKPKEWMPWSLLAAGAIVVIYTFSIPGRTISEE